ncbi:type II toxin-antitoxin system Phd/YefM family antitoxin [Pontiellaceae bacterium B12227]|nr:type II toxin-antitoxin system Phd/YefM family antitoxin [Pontiellaceae bacterium B12227]
MITIPAQDIKRRGIGAVDEFIANEPVHIIKNNQPKYVILQEEDYQMMMEDLALARIEASEADLQAGRIRKGSAAELMKELDEAE